MWPYVAILVLIAVCSLAFAIRERIRMKRLRARMKLKLQLIKRDRDALRAFTSWREEHPETPIHTSEPKRLLHRCESAYLELTEYFPEFRNSEREKVFQALDL